MQVVVVVVDREVALVVLMEVKEVEVREEVLVIVSQHGWVYLEQMVLVVVVGGQVPVLVLII